MPGTFTQVEFPEGQQEPSGQVTALSGQTQIGGGPLELLAQTFPRGQQIGVPSVFVPQGGSNVSGQTHSPLLHSRGCGQQIVHVVGVVPVAHGDSPGGHTQIPA